MSEPARPGVVASRLPYVWDYDLDEASFRAILAGRETLGSLDRDWAAVRLLEHAPYAEVRRLLSLGELVAGWPTWRRRIRAEDLSLTRRLIAGGSLLGIEVLDHIIVGDGSWRWISLKERGVL